ncbi:hypothetical protein RJ639_011100 [Escallonia herrerae]|uniref:Uncharacterized protein n=1 Tax=Escallonia herrerae TaxID=1293975 RepID=A0AA88VLF2_9ASTE|nr:hypothetical protein RJ639_011100 [Escallonia herrerae]
MSNTLFHFYHTVKNAKELWNQLERRYITEDATSKRSVMEQFNEIKTILDRYSQHKLALDELIVVTSIIDKLPPSWMNFRNGLKHHKEDMNLDELGTHVRIEEDLRKEEKSKNEGVSKILTLEEEEYGYATRGYTEYGQDEWNKASYRGYSNGGNVYGSVTVDGELGRKSSGSRYIPAAEYVTREIAFQQVHMPMGTGPDLLTRVIYPQVMPTEDTGDAMEILNKSDRTSSIHADAPTSQVSAPFLHNGDRSATILASADAPQPGLSAPPLTVQGKYIDADTSDRSSSTSVASSQSRSNTAPLAAGPKIGNPFETVDNREVPRRYARLFKIA